jgi:hypothetical protein
VFCFKLDGLRSVGDGVGRTAAEGSPGSFDQAVGHWQSHVVGLDDLDSFVHGLIVGAL